MSGTSADCIDAVVTQITGVDRDTIAAQLAFVESPLSTDLRQRIWALPDEQYENTCELNFLLGHAFADAALAAVEAASLTTDDIDLIGSHGQTARHQPPGEDRVPSTLQIGEAAVIAERCRTTTISDFRVADVAAGGHGAPLIPMVDALLFRHPTENRALLNLGGIANITVVPTGDTDKIVAFDTGPANMPLDAIARAASNGARSFDEGGVLARSGEVIADLLPELLAHPYFLLDAPKSTGREVFGRSFIYPLIDRYSNRLNDLMATLIELVATTIGDAVTTSARTCTVGDVFVSGGGVHNGVLMHAIARHCAPVNVRSLGELGIDPDAKEALGFAVLANQTLFGKPSNVPSATGASGPRVLGKITLGPIS